MQFWIFGEPIPWPRPRVARNGGVYVHEKARAWMNCIILYATVAKKAAPMITGQVAVSLRFLLPKAARGDIDNYIKGVLDGITKAGVWKDDRQVKKLYTELVTCDSVQAPGVCVEITEY